MELESSRPDGPLTVGRQLNIKTKPITERRIVVLLATTSLFATIAALEACLVKLGQEQLGAAAARCRQQAKPHGFAGNPDVYGLGIRLGLYFQWIGSLTANFFLARERRPTLAAFVVFNLSIAIAVLVLVFRHACAFTAEMYIVFTMFWGGVNAIGFPVIDVERTVKWIRKGEKAPPRPLSTPNAFSLGLNVLMFPVTIWYWIRLAMVGERDFAATPGGTALFFFTKMQGSDIRPVSIYLAIMSILVFLWLIINLVPNFAGEDHADRLLDTFTCVFYSPLILIYSIHLIPVTFLVGMPTVYLSSACKRVAIGFRVLFKGEAISKAVSTYIDSLDLSAMLSNSVLVTVYCLPQSPLPLPSTTDITHYT